MEGKNEVALSESDENAVREAQVTQFIKNSAVSRLAGVEVADIPPQYVYRVKDRPTVKEAFNAIFDLIGGVPRLALWASQHPDQFASLYVKVMTEAEKAPAASGNIIIQNNVPSSGLDTGNYETVFNNGTNVIDVDSDEDDE